MSLNFSSLIRLPCSVRRRYLLSLNWYFIFFFTSGFCGVLYELIWLRLSMAQFGVTTAMVSIVLSVFMAGLGLGSWASGRWLGTNEQPRKIPALRLYAATELLIGIAGVTVPYGLLWGHRLLERTGRSSSFAYYWIAGLWVAFILLPGCTLMGATVPLGMRAITQTLPAERRRSFSYLYMSNVGGAVFGTMLPLFFIELWGFRGTLRIGAVSNAAIALSAALLSGASPQLAPEPPRLATSPAAVSANRGILFVLFLSGLTSMGMEVVWVRSYTPYFGTMVYAFASILGVYLLATFVGSVFYRRWSSRWAKENPLVWTLLAVCALLPLIAADPALNVRLPQFVMSFFPLARSLQRLFLGVMPFTGLLGFLTPMLVDRFSRGDPRKAGFAYAVNVVGCILGPLVAGFGLLPFLSERWALVLLTLPWLMIGVAPLRPTAKLSLAWRLAAYVLFAAAAVLIYVGRGYQDLYRDGRVLRDQTATVIATGKGLGKQLLVNGFGVTSLTPITKVMAHLPLAHLDRAPQNALVICFGMGTTFRSLRSWGIPVTAVELVPSVPLLFSYYHADGARILGSPLSRVIIDDGRRFLERRSEQYDVITIDPPPPLNAAASSLLYSEEFYAVARRRLRPDGILQQWVPALPDMNAIDVAAVTRSLRNSFPYVRAFHDGFGIHFLCSNRPTPYRNPDELLSRMPENAIDDFAEWDITPGGNPRDAAKSRLDGLLRGEMNVDQLIAASPETPSLTDDRPINEYNALRRWRARDGGAVDEKSARN
jgi:spermidine synthase